MARFSTGLRNSVASDYGLGLMMNGGVIRVYGGQRPASPDEAPGALLLGEITTEGKVFFPVNDPNNAGLLLTLMSPGVLTNDGEWRLKGMNDGEAQWWRWCWRLADSNLQSTFYPRVDGLVNTELRLGVTYITAFTNVEIEQFIFSLSIGT
jgi:hypothetical protein